MAKTKKQQEEEIVDVQEVYSKTEQFLDKYKQIITAVVVAVAAIIFGVVYYFNFYLPPLEEEAQNEIFHAQRHFANDSLSLAMYGDTDGNPGFEEIASNYGSTNAGNLAHYYMGVSLLRTGDFEGAILYLDRYKAKDEITPSIKYGAMGDAYSELGDYKEALNYYKKAINSVENDFTTPIYLMKAGLVAEELGKGEDAKKYYSRIKADYPNSSQARNIEKYIKRAVALS